MDAYGRKRVWSLPAEPSPIGVGFLKWSAGSRLKDTSPLDHHCHQFWYHLLHDEPSDVPTKETNNDGSDHKTHAPPTDCLSMQAAMGHGCPCDGIFKGTSKL